MLYIRVIVKGIASVPARSFKSTRSYVHARQLAQRAEKVVSDSPGLVDFAIGLVNSVDNLPDGQVKFLGKFKLQSCNQSCRSIIFGGLVEMTFGLVHATVSDKNSWDMCKDTSTKRCFFRSCAPLVTLSLSKLFIAVRSPNLVYQH